MQWTQQFTRRFNSGPERSRRSLEIPEFHGCGTQNVGAKIRRTKVGVTRCSRNHNWWCFWCCGSRPTGQEQPPKSFRYSTESKIRGSQAVTNTGPTFYSRHPDAYTITQKFAQTRKRTKSRGCWGRSRKQSGHYCTSARVYQTCCSFGYVTRNYTKFCTPQFTIGPGASPALDLHDTLIRWRLISFSTLLGG